MSEVRVRHLEPWVVDFLRERARAEGHQHLESFLREHLREEAMRKRREFAAKLKATQDAMREKYGILTDSTPGIRADREERG